jgi:hypothetical protein
MDMDDVTQQNAALVEEAAAAAQSMQDQSGHLIEVVSVFKLDGTRAGVATPLKVATNLIQTKAGATQKLGTTRGAKRSVPAAKPLKQVANARPATTAGEGWEEF